MSSANTIQGMVWPDNICEGIIRFGEKRAKAASPGSDEEIQGIVVANAGRAFREINRAAEDPEIDDQEFRRIARDALHGQRSGEQ